MKPTQIRTQMQTKTVSAQGRSIGRRTLIRGGGVALALPWLEIMRPARALGAAPGEGEPRRYVTWFTANGTVPDQWRVSGDESNYGFSRILKPLERHRKDLLILQNMTLAGDGYAHWITMMHQLTGRRFIKGKAVAETAASISIDQEIARQYGNRTKFGSLQLGIITGADDDHGIGTVSYQGADKPLFMQDNPYETFSRLFKDAADPAAAMRKRDLRKSILDSVLNNAKLFEGKLGREDRARLDAHMTSIRELETRILTKDAPGGTCAAPAALPDGQPAGTQLDWKKNDNAPLLGELQMELIKLAFSCDLTRVVTLQWARAFGSGRVHRWLPGVTGNWHNLSHEAAEQGNANSKEQMVKIETWYSEQLAKFLDKLKSVKEGDKTLLDSSVVFCTNEFGWNHVHDQMPFMLAGSCRGFFKTGRQLSYAKGTMHNGILVAILNAMGIPTEQWGDPKWSKGQLPRLQ